MDFADVKSAITRVQGDSQAKTKLETLVLGTVGLLEVQVSILDLLQYGRIKPIDHDIESVHCESQNSQKDNERYKSTWQSSEGASTFVSQINLFPENV